MMKEFRDFIFRGNALDLAIGVIIALAFGAVVTALTEGVLMALVAAIFGKPDFNSLAFTINGATIQYGRVLTAIVNLFMVGIVLYALVKAVNRVRGQTVLVPETDHDLLAQIRDELRNHPLQRDMGPQVKPAGTH
ncbi:MAG: large conductance mechanosensitive channel protein MscL [Kofleriaceae bacterium]|nr:large conductance mechanosensitive channel protein MscL [Kofleriaceae bacterium]